MKPDIGDCVYVLHFKRWGKTLIDGQLKGKLWWDRRLNALIEEATTPIPVENLWDGKPAEPAPIPYEIEMGLEKEKEVKNE